MTDLEKAQEIIGGGCNRQGCHECGGGLSVAEGCVEFRHLKEMAEWKEQQMIEKAVNFLNENLMRTLLFDKYDKENFIDNFRKAMEE